VLPADAVWAGFDGACPAPSAFLRRRSSSFFDRFIRATRFFPERLEPMSLLLE